MSQERRAQDMQQMLGVLDSGFKLVGRAFRTFELVNSHLAEQFTITDGGFPVGLVNIMPWAMLIYQKPQSPTPPVHMLYEGFDNIGKDLTAYEEAMGKISDGVWEESAKCWGEERDDEIENEDWIKNNAPRVPDPLLPATLIERGFSTLHRTFDVFESFMKEQGRLEEGEVVDPPATLADAQSKSNGTIKALRKVALNGQESAKDNSSKKESYSRKVLANATAISPGAQRIQVHSVEKPLNGDMSTRHDTAKEDVPTKGQRGNIETSASARLANTQHSQSILMAGPSRKHAPSDQDSGQNDLLPPAKRRAVHGQEPHSPGQDSAQRPPGLPLRPRPSKRRS